MYGAASQQNIIALTPSERVDIRASLQCICDVTHGLLPKNYTIQTVSVFTPDAQQYGVAVRPPHGSSVRVELDIRSFKDSGEGLREYEMSKEDCREVAQEVAASAVVQFWGSDGAIDEDWSAS